MKKIIYLITFTILLGSLESCGESEELLTDTNSALTEPKESWVHIPMSVDSIKQFGTYNALGFGYDVTGEYANASYIRTKIIDAQEFHLANPTSYVEIPISSGEYKETYSANALIFSQKLSQNTNTTQNLAVFGKTIPFANAVQNNKYDPTYIYGTYNSTIKTKRYLFEVSINKLISFLTDEFTSDIKQKTPSQIVDKYGTHVMTNIYVGGSYDLIFQAKTKNPDRERAAYLGVKDYSSSNNSSLIGEASLNYSKRIYYKTRGGAKAQNIAGMYNLDNITPSFDIAVWQSTLSNNNSVLVDFGQNGLVPIYDFVQDQAKKSELKMYIDQYLEANKVILGS